MKYIIREDAEFYKLHFLKKYLKGTNGIVAGGCFKNIFNNEKVKDVDIFFRNEKDFDNAVNMYKENDNFYKCYQNKKVVAFKEKETGVVVELIKKIYGKPKEILDAFDFTIVQFCYFYDTEILELEDEVIHNYQILHHGKYFEHLHEKRLVLEEDNHLDYPFSTFERALRYTGYGYRLCKESKVNLINSLRTADDFSENELSQSLYDGLD